VSDTNLLASPADLAILERLKDADLTGASRLLTEHAENARLRSGFVETPRDR
jgi:hypothetical protein